MLINGMCSEEGRAGLGGERGAVAYQTENELFELMATENGYDIIDDQSLNTRDLIFLYKNVDVDTKLTAKDNDEQRRPPNQLVETIVYNDDKDSVSVVSDDSEIYSHEDLQDIFLINNERIDLINTMPSIPHCLCHKCGDFKFQWSNLTTDYDRQFLFKDPYIQQQLKNINLMPESEGFNTMLPASLLDYICCKRLDDNYNFYMENIIIYVKHTIEQLRRISNGDYLTEEAREKWREVEKEFKTARSDDTKALATSVSIPLHIESKVNGHRSTWDDIVHSEVDVRTLSKMLEKKIIIEIPKLICGSYKLFSQQRDDNLIISCKKDSNNDIVQDREESRVDVVFQLKRSDSGHVISNINSIMILQKMPSITSTESNIVQCQQLEFVNNVNPLEKRVTIVEIVDEEKNETEPCEQGTDVDETSAVNDCVNENSVTTEFSSEKHDESLTEQYNFCSSPLNVYDKGLFSISRKLSSKTETNLTIISPDELRCTIQRLNMQAPVLEEPDTPSNKKKSPTRVRIKSPYENKSFFIEEKKRKRLLEIREKREKKKMALSENCKIKKHKNGKGAIMAQPSSSVTKLSITNKSFYNSIYGESLHHESAISKKAGKWQKKEVGLKEDELENDFLKSSFTTLGQNSFDDGCTETVMQMQQHLNEEKCLSADSALSCYDSKINLLSNLVTSSGTDCDNTSEGDSSPLQKSERNENALLQDEGDDLDQGSFNLVPTNTPKPILPHKGEDEQKKTLSPVECRKSIDKIYDLMKKLEKIDESEVAQSSKHNSNKVHGRRSSTIQMSDSGTSIKHHDTSSNPSSFSFGKAVSTNKCSYKETDKKEVPATVVPKVIISTKSQTSKGNMDRNKSDRKRNVASPSAQVPDNPLKAISQLLHEFDNVQKNRLKPHKKSDHDDIKTSSRQGSSKKPRQEQPQKEVGAAPGRFQQSRERRSRSGRLIDTQPIAHQQVTYADDKHIGRSARRNISDIIDEAKEARGEAVRGPPRPYSRLNTLAQPKKLYYQAQNEDYYNRNGRNIIAHRINRATISAPVVDKNIPTTYPRNRRKGTETAPTPSTKPIFPTASPIEKVMRPRRSASNSPTRKNESTYKHNTVPVTPENLKKKMVAVESYVKTHYGPIDTNQAIGREVHKSRVPLIPNDIELESLTSSPTAEESTELGNKLHYMINTMIGNAPCLSILAETKESTSKLSNDGLEKLTSDSLLKIVEHKSESDYIVDIFEDKNIVTAVASLPKDKASEDRAADENSGDVENAQYDVQPFNSATELRKLENALYKKISVGALPKRLRIKNLTLTPKQSLQQVIVVQSGDAGSLLIKSSISQTIRTSESKTDSLTALKPFAAISSTHVKWGPSDIPMQVATIGYAFPTYQSVQSSSITPRIYTLHQRNIGPKLKSPKKEITQGACKSNKTSQCFKGIHTESSAEQSTQANILIPIPSSRNINMNTTEKEHNVKTESDPTSNEKFNKTEETVTSKDPEPITNSTQTSQVTSKMETYTDVLKEDTPRSLSGNIDHSTSLDILMGLLNEIRKVTGETPTKNIDKETNYSSNGKDLEIILNAVNQDSLIKKQCRDIVSTTSLDKLEQLYSNHSIYFYNLLRDEQEQKDTDTNIVERKLSICNQPMNVDKGVNVDHDKQYVNRLTDAPSCFLSVTINQSTNVTDTVFGVISEPSTQSVYSIAEYDTLYCNSTFNKIVEIPTIEANEILINSDSYNESDCLQLKIATKKELSTVSISNTSEYVLDNKGDTCANRVIEVCKKLSRKLSRNILTNNTTLTVDLDFDPLMKMKRDILVTVYSFLVFTVFAALSFPKLFNYHVDV